MLLHVWLSAFDTIVKFRCQSLFCVGWKWSFCVNSFYNHIFLVGYPFSGQERDILSDTIYVKRRRYIGFVLLLFIQLLSPTFHTYIYACIFPPVAALPAERSHLSFFVFFFLVLSDLKLHGGEHVQLFHALGHIIGASFSSFPGNTRAIALRKPNAIAPKQNQHRYCSMMFCKTSKHLNNTALHASTRHLPVILTRKK